MPLMLEELRAQYPDFEHFNIIKSNIEAYEYCPAQHRTAQHRIAQHSVVQDSVAEDSVA
jgi:hypothetical protein